jgi:hypothetical protein
MSRDVRAAARLVLDSTEGSLAQAAGGDPAVCAAAIEVVFTSAAKFSLLFSAVKTLF